MEIRALDCWASGGVLRLERFSTAATPYWSANDLPIKFLGSSGGGRLANRGVDVRIGGGRSIQATDGLWLFPLVGAEAGSCNV